MNCNNSSGVLHIDNLDASKSNKAYKIWCDLIGGSSTTGVTSVNSVGAALGCDAPQGKEYENIPNSSIGVFVGDIQNKSKKRNIYYVINSRSKSNARLAADGMFGYVDKVSSYEKLINGLDSEAPELYNWFRTNFPAQVINLTFEQTVAEEAHRQAVSVKKYPVVENASKYPTNRNGDAIWLEMNPNTLIGKELAKRDRLTDGYKWSGYCKTVRVSSSYQSSVDKTTSGWLIENISWLFKFLETIDAGGVPFYIVFRVRKHEKTSILQLVNSISTLASIASSFIPLVGGFVGEAAKKALTGVASYAKEVINICNSGATQSIASVLDTGKIATNDFWGFAVTAASYMSPEFVRGIEQKANGISATVTQFVAENYNSIIGNRVNSILGITEAEKNKFNAALINGGSGILTTFAGITEEAASSFDEVQNRLQNYKNLTVSDLLTRFSYKSSSEISTKTISGDFTLEPIFQQLGITLTDQTLISTLPNASKIFGRAIGDPGGINYISSFEQPENFLYGAIAGVKGFPVAAENWLEFSARSFLTASQAEPEKILTLPPSINGDLKDCLAKKLKEAGRNVLQCDKGYKYNTSTKKCERAGFFSQYITPKNAVILAGAAAAAYSVKKYLI